MGLVLGLHSRRSPPIPYPSPFGPHVVWEPDVLAQYREEVGSLRLEHHGEKAHRQAWLFPPCGFIRGQTCKVILIVALLVSIPSTYLFVAHETSFDFISSMGEPESIEGMNAMRTWSGHHAHSDSHHGDTIIYNNETGEFNLEYLDAVNNVTSDIANSPSVQQVNGITWPYGEQIDYRSLISFMKSAIRLSRACSRTCPQTVRA